MIEIIPAISVVGNKVARYNHCDLENVTLYDQTPLEAAMHFQENGIKKLHLLDLEGARKGRVVNTHVLEQISGYTDLEIDFGGGITYDDDIRVAFEYGATMINAASVAVLNRELFSSWIISFGRKKIVLSVDVINEKVYTRGWVHRSESDLFELLEYYHNLGILYVKCSDITKDGSLTGPAFDLYKKILNRFPDINLIASGGIREVRDVEILQDLGVHGVIFAKAYYEGRIKLEELQKFLV